MKYAIIIPDGCADEPQESLQGQTPLEAAQTPFMDAIARQGMVGQAAHVPAHLPAGSDVANLSLLGYDPNVFFTGRAPLEAAAQDIALGAGDWAIRCNLVTIEDQVMRDFTADHISTEEARELLATLQAEINSPQLEFVPGVSYRNLLIYRGSADAPPFSRESRSTPPHDLTDQTVVDDYPRGPGSALLNELMARSVDVFAQHPVNVARKAAGKLPATNIWLWGLGGAPRLESFQERYGLLGQMITAVDLLRGLAKLMGWRVIHVPGATGYTDTDYAAKGRYAIDALDHGDLICVHVEAPDEASHEGDIAAKMAALAEIDKHIVGPLHAALQARGDYRILVTPDHPTPVRTKTHSHGRVPFAIAGTGIAASGSSAYHERAAAASPWDFPDGSLLMQHFLTYRSPGVPHP